MADLNVQGNKSFSSNYFCGGKFVSMHATTNRPYIVMLNEMLSLTVPHYFRMKKKFVTKTEH